MSRDYAYTQAQVNMYSYIYFCIVLLVNSEYVNSLSNVHLSVDNHVSQECQEDLNSTLLSPNITTDTAHALDAFGKPGSGLLVGDLVWLGTYKECQDLELFHYCLVDYRINISDINIPGKEKLPSIVPVRLGTCFPKSCNKEDLLIGITQVIDDKLHNIITLDVAPSGVQCSDPINMWSDGVFVFTFVLCCILGSLMMGGYVLDIILRQSNQRIPLTNPSSNNVHVSNGSAESSPLLSTEQEIESKFHKSLSCRFLLCFAFNRNLSKLLDTKQNERSILCLNGIRVISLSWVILGHTFAVILSTQSIDNAITFTTIIKRFGFQAVLNAPFAVDTFFLLSGLLVTLGCLNRLEKNNGRLPWLWFYFHRFWRLTPALCFIVLVTMCQQYLAEGPVWFPLAKNMAQHCQEYWWTTILYINNFYPTRFNEQCVGHTWYLSNDMQFFVVSPIFLILLYKFKKLGILSLVFTCLVSFGITIGLIVSNDFDIAASVAGIAGGANGRADLGGSNFTTTVYQKPYCRISVYLVGMATGVLMHQYQRFRMPRMLVLLGWLLAATLGMLVVYGLYPAVSEGASLSAVGNALYGALSRCTWGFAVSWVIFACYFGHGGIINQFLSWKGWVPLSRLTYTAYLIHQPVIYQFYQAHKVPWHLDLLDFCYYFVAFAGLTYSAAVIFSLAVEYPFANMEKLFMPGSLQTNRVRKDDNSKRDKV